MPEVAKTMDGFRKETRPFKTYFRFNIRSANTDDSWDLNLQDKLDFQDFCGLNFGIITQ